LEVGSGGDAWLKPGAAVVGRAGRGFGRGLCGMDW